MGFCLHNNAAVAALAAQVSGAKRVLIVDWVMPMTLLTCVDLYFTYVIYISALILVDWVSSVYLQYF